MYSLSKSFERVDKQLNNQVFNMLIVLVLALLVS